jgi:hypothetical protein
MNKFVMFLSASLFVFVLFSCKNNGEYDSNVNTIDRKVSLTREEFISIAYDNPKELSKREVQFIIMMFEITLEKEILAKENVDNISLYEAKEKYYLSLDGNRFISKSDAISNLSSNEAIPIYRCDLIQKSDTGFVFVSADERFPCVLAYVPKGNLNKREMSSVYTGIDIMLELSEKSLLNNIAYFNHLKDSLRERTLEKISKELEISVSDATFDKVRDYLTVEGKPATKSSIIPRLSGLMGQINPLITTQWAQQQPYNYQLNTGCDELVMGNYVSHYPAGCLVTAAAQVIAHIEPSMQVTRVNGQTVTINWAQLKQTPSLLPGWFYTNVPTDIQNRIDMVSGLIKVIFTGSSTIQGCEGSSTNVANMLTYLNTKISTGEYTSGLNVTTVKSSLDAMKVVIAGGRNSSGTTGKDSHAWILDGYAICSKVSNTTNTSDTIKALVQNYDLFLHANMGWSGTGDGYYFVNSNLVVTFDTGDGYHYDSNFWFIPNLTSK